MTEHIVLSDTKVYLRPVVLIPPEKNYVPDEEKLAESSKRTKEILNRLEALKKA